MNVRMLALAATVLLAMSGCFQYATLVELNADGSGKLHLRVLFSKELDSNSSKSGDKSKTAAMMEKAQQHFVAMTEQLGDGVTFVETKRIESKPGWIGLQATYAFVDVNKLKLPTEPPEFPDSKEKSDSKEKEKSDTKEKSPIFTGRGPYIFQYTPGADNKLEVRIEPPTADPKTNGEADPFADAGLDVKAAKSVGKEFGNAFALAIVKAMSPDIRLSMMVKVDGVITESSGVTRANENSVFLCDFNMGEFARSDLFEKAVLEKWDFERLVEEKVPGLKTHRADETVTIQFVNKR